MMRERLQRRAPQKLRSRLPQAKSLRVSSEKVRLSKAAKSSRQPCQSLKSQVRLTKLYLLKVADRTTRQHLTKLKHLRLLKP
jgi:hypothetical protein